MKHNENSTKMFSFALLLAVFFLLIGCNKGDDPVNPDELSDAEIAQIATEELENVADLMPLEFYEEIEAMPITEVDPGNILLPNGLLAQDFDIDLDDQASKLNISAFDAKNALVKKLSAEAIRLTRDDLFVFPDEGEDRPAQNGLAFVFGSKQIQERERYVYAGLQFPFFYIPCSEYLYGLDCSGYVSNVFQAAGLPMSLTNTADQIRQEGTLLNALKASFPNIKVTVDNLGAIPPAEWQSGDIVYWLKPDGTTADHIGMFFEHSGGLVLANSAGHPIKCESNKSVNAGPVLRNFAFASDKLLNAQYGYRIVRFNVEDSKTIYLRCADQDFDVLETQISLNLEKDYFNTFTTLISDYDGSLLNLEFKLSYQADSKILIVEFSIVGGSRIDRAEFNMTTDDTGYVTMTKIVDNGGCVAAMRIVNNLVTSQKKKSANSVAPSAGSRLSGNPKLK